MVRLSLEGQTWEIKGGKRHFTTTEVYRKLQQGVITKKHLCRCKIQPAWQPIGLNFSIVGSYGVLRHLGESLFGQIYRACLIHPSQEDTVILLKPREKFLLEHSENLGYQSIEHLSPEKNQEKGARHSKAQLGQMFFLEMKSISQLKNCIHVAPMIDHDISTPYQVFSDCYEENLAQRKEKNFSLQDTFRWGKGIAEALLKGEETTPHPLIHCDLTPNNIWLSSDDVRLACFGHAQWLEQFDIHSFFPDKPLPFYMAPETFDGKISSASNVWSWGVILYELLSKKKPFTGKSLLPLMTQAKTAPLSFDETSIPKNFQGLLEASLAKNPADRPHIRACLEALKHIQETDSSPFLGKISSQTENFNASLESKMVMNNEPRNPYLEENNLERLKNQIDENIETLIQENVKTKEQSAEDSSLEKTEKEEHSRSKKESKASGFEDYSQIHYPHLKVCIGLFIALAILYIPFAHALAVPLGVHSLLQKHVGVPVAIAKISQEIPLMMQLFPLIVLFSLLIFPYIMLHNLSNVQGNQILDKVTYPSLIFLFSIVFFLVLSTVYAYEIPTLRSAKYLKINIEEFHAISKDNERLTYSLAFDPALALDSRSFIGSSTFYRNNLSKLKWILYLFYIMGIIYGLGIFFSTLNPRYAKIWGITQISASAFMLTIAFMAHNGKTPANYHLALWITQVVNYLVAAVYYHRAYNYLIYNRQKML